MPMTWNTLTAAKGQSGSIATWASYTKLDVEPILDEAQSLLWMQLRLLEMRTSVLLFLAQNAADLVLPANFIEPIGGMWAQSLNYVIGQRDVSYIKDQRIFNETTGTLGTNPLTTTLNSSAINVNFPGHGFVSGGANSFSLSGATAVGGITPAGGYYITAIIDANNFTIDNPNIAPVATSAATGGGSNVVYLADILQQGLPQFFAIYNNIQTATYSAMFDWATSQPLNFHFNYYASLPLLSNTNPTNVLTNRYPHLLRRACLVSAAEFMNDDMAVKRLMDNPVTGLTAMIQRVNIENERWMSGMTIETETP